MKQSILTLSFIIAALTGALSVQAEIADQTLDNHEYALRPIAGAEVIETSVHSRCPINARCLVPTTTMYKVRIPLTSCVNTLTAISYDFDIHSTPYVTHTGHKVAGRVTLKLSGFEVLSKRALAAFCSGNASQSITISSIGNLENYEVVVQAPRLALPSSR